MTTHGRAFDVLRDWDSSIQMFREEQTRVPRLSPTINVAEDLSGSMFIMMDNIKAFGGYPNAVIAFYAFLTCSTRAVKAAGSAIAISDRTLRFRVMPAFFRPFIKVE